MATAAGSEAAAGAGAGAAAPAARTPHAARELPLAYPLDLGLSLAALRRGGRDPAYRRTQDGSVWRASLTPDGAGTLRVRIRPDEAVAEAEAWGPGAGWLLDRLPGLLGAGDAPETFVAHHPVLRDAHRRRPGFRIVATARMWEALAPAILEQKVTGLEARESWRQLLWRFGTPAPGPEAVAGWMRVPPAPRVWAQLAVWDWHLAGVDPKRARTIRTAAGVAGRVEEAYALGRDVATRRLLALPGIGPWTVAETLQRACGDADAISVGDLHVPGLVGYALTGRRTDDAGMLALLEPYAGHRYRVQRLLETTASRPPRRAPRFAPNDHRRR